MASAPPALSLWLIKETASQELQVTLVIPVVADHKKSHYTCQCQSFTVIE